MKYGYDIHMGFGRAEISSIGTGKENQEILPVEEAEGYEIRGISSDEVMVHGGAWFKYWIKGSGNG